MLDNTKPMLLILSGAAVLFAITGLSLAHYKVFAPAFEDARRETFEHSASYIQGKINYLNRLKGEYAIADKEQKIALKSVIQREAATVDRSKLPTDLVRFLEELEHAD